MPTKQATTRRRKTSPSPGRKRKRKSGASLLRGFPWWGVLAGSLLVVAVYVALLYHFFVGPLSFRWRALYGEPDYPQEYDVRGIDISHYQKDIDWEVLRNAKVGGRPLRFVIVKATEGLTMTDENFNDNFYRVRENDLIRGAYHFYIPGSDPRGQAEFYLRQVHLEPGDLPPILDIERRGDEPLEQFQAGVRRWLEIVEAVYETAPVIYTNLDFRRKYLSDPAFDRYPLWIANYYKRKLTYEGEWALWQYTDLGSLPGVKHKVDFDLFNGSLQDLRGFLLPGETGLDMID
ncbi:MAG: glycoside hydrolase family 25 protein [Prevotellaceae bacterium]|nr:glycoside hydrolase family 25 protein [Prevotellaceae bacterium]